MFRLEGASALVRDALGPGLTDLFALLTTLGDPTFLVGVVGVLYLFSEDRSGAATLLAYSLVAVAATITLKEGLALPRPPAGVRAVEAEPGSYGFPSGHAIGAAAVYGGLPVVFERLRRKRVAVATVGLVGLIGLSRVVIGVHYLGDVLAGFAVGAVVLGGLALAVGDRRVVASLLGVAVVVPGVVVTGAGTDAVFTLGTTLGAAGVFSWLDPGALPGADSRLQQAIIVVVGAAVAGGVYAIVSLIGHPVATLLGGFVIVTAGLTLPAAVRWLPSRAVAPG